MFLVNDEFEHICLQMMNVNMSTFNLSCASCLTLMHCVLTFDFDTVHSRASAPGISDATTDAVSLYICKTLLHQIIQDSLKKKKRKKGFKSRLPHQQRYL